MGYFILLVIIGYFVYREFVKPKTKRDFVEEARTEPILINDDSRAVKGIYGKKNLLSKGEYSFWKDLKEKCGDEFIICPKVRMEDFLYVNDRLSKGDKMKYRNWIKSRHIDFLLCDARLFILAGIELDDNSHKTDDSQKIDKMKNDIFAEVGIPLYRVNLSQGYVKKQIDEILAKHTTRREEQTATEEVANK